MGIISPLGRGYSSAGRALAWHARGHRFDPGYLHQPDLKRYPQSPSSRGLGHRPFTAVTGVRIPVGTPSMPRFGQTEVCRTSRVIKTPARREREPVVDATLTVAWVELDP